MNASRANQPNELQDLRSRMNRLFESEGESTRLWAPVVDISEDDHQIVLEAELPGMNKEEIDIQLNGESLTLRGERRIEQSQKGEQYHRVERQYGAWQRTFQVEVPIDAQNVSADYRDGVLTVTIPKAEDVKPRQIEISTKN